MIQHGEGMMKSVTFVYFSLTILISVVFFAGCRKAEPVALRLYCNETFWHVMQEEAKAFEQVYGVRTELVPIFQLKQSEPSQTPKPISNGKWELDYDLSALITSLSENRLADMYLTDSPLEIDRLRSFLLASHEYPFCFLTMLLLVPKGNPNQLHFVHDVLEKKLRLGITAPAKDGSGIVASDIVSKLSVGNDSLEHILQFDRQYDLLQALEEKKIDAALVWDATNLKTYLATKYSTEYYAKYKTRFDEAKEKWQVDKIAQLIDEMFAELYKDKDFAEKILLAPPQDDQIGEHCVVQISLLSLSTTLHDAAVRRFADFLISGQGKEILRKHGFAPKP